MYKKNIFIVLFVSMFFYLPYTASASDKEWIVYFQDKNRAMEYTNQHPDQVLAQEGNILKLNSRPSSYYGIKNIEENHLKQASLSNMNDPLIDKQWYLNTIGFNSTRDISPTPPPNLLKGTEFKVDGESIIYNGEPLFTNEFIIKLNKMVLRRLTIELDSVPQEEWTLTVFDSYTGKQISQNSGQSKILDVLLPKNIGYDSLKVTIDSPSSYTVKKVIGANNPIVAVVDSGIAQHEDFCSNILTSLGKDLVEGMPTPIDQFGHGTHVTGILAGCSDNSIGISGVIGKAPVDIIPLKVLDASGLGGDFEISQALNMAIEMELDAVNLSLAGKGQTNMLEESIRNAFTNNIPVIVAAGNWKASTEKVYPASYPYVITVSGVDQSNQKVPSSNFGWEVDISAPGAGILSTYLDNEYKSLTGTSMAAPMVTGAAALVKRTHPDIDIAALREILLSSSTDILTKGYDIYSGAGIINFSKLEKAVVTPSVTWLNLKENQPFEQKEYTIAYSPSLRGKKMMIIQDEKILYNDKINSQEGSMLLNPDSVQPKVKLFTMVYDPAEAIIHDSHQVFLHNTSVREKTFSDVPSTFWAYKEIHHASSLGIVNGYETGKFKPQEKISRKHSLMMMNRLFRWEPSGKISEPFQDLKWDLEEMDYSSLSIMSASSMDIINGYPDHSFRPQQSLTRAQMALILARALGLNESLTALQPYPFKDLPSEGELYAAVQNLADAGIITKQSSFKPYEKINRGQFAAMLSRTITYLN
jgi:hypothetical protein